MNIHRFYEFWLNYLELDDVNELHISSENIFLVYFQRWTKIYIQIITKPEKKKKNRKKVSNLFIGDTLCLILFFCLFFQLFVAFYCIWKCFKKSCIIFQMTDGRNSIYQGSIDFQLIFKLSHKLLIYFLRIFNPYKICYSFGFFISLFCSGPCAFLFSESLMHLHALLILGTFFSPLYFHLYGVLFYEGIYSFSMNWPRQEMLPYHFSDTFLVHYNDAMREVWLTPSKLTMCS